MTISEPFDCSFYLITRASLVVTQHLKATLEAAGVSGVRPSYLPVLMGLWQDDGLRLRDLGRRAGLEPSTMTGLIDRMERDGFVTRTPDPEDRRAHRIRLTARGREIRTATEAAMEESLDAVLGGVPEDELDRLKDVLRAILNNADRGVFE